MTNFSTLNQWSHVFASWYSPLVFDESSNGAGTSDLPQYLANTLNCSTNLTAAQNVWRYKNTLVTLYMIFLIQYQHTYTFARMEINPWETMLKL